MANHNPQLNSSADTCGKPDEVVEPKAVTAANKPALVCAPCWICLEDGPDESGEPLVRDCSCRGETSAGYHISCLINYAKSRTQKLMRRGSTLSYDPAGHNSVKSAWTLCPNCSGPYVGAVGNRMADAMMETTQHLPDTHWVRFHALLSLVDLRLLQLTADKALSSTNSQAYPLPFDEINVLLRVVEEDTPALLFSMNGKQPPERIMVQWRNSEIASLLLKKGRLHAVIGEKEEALHCYETANAKLIATALNGGNVEKLSFEARTHLHNLKVKMGLTTPSDDVKQLREELAAQTKPHAQMLIKANLSRALTKLDPPEYFEAIKLLGEVFAATKRLFGPEHILSLSATQQLANAKEEYRAYLKSVATKK